MRTLCCIVLVTVFWFGGGAKLDAAPEALSFNERAVLTHLQKVSNGTLQIEWDEETKTPAKLSGMFSPPSRHSPEWIAYRFLQDTKRLYGLSNVKRSLRIKQTSRTADGGVNLELERHLFGTPVWGEGLTMVINQDGVLTQITGRITPHLERKLFGYPMRPTISSQQAIELAAMKHPDWNQVKTKTVTASLFYLPLANTPQLAYLVTYESLDGNHHHLFIHAITKRIMTEKNPFAIEGVLSLSFRSAYAHSSCVSNRCLNRASKNST
ncbi:MAG: hypothetical protein ACM32O_15290 [Clostridia bacterium]